MSAKYTSLLEACDKVQLTGKLGILEESSLDEAASIKMQLMLNENLTFIKNQITRTPLVENIQVALAEKWTQAILEDISLENPFVQPDEGLTAGEMAAMGAAGTFGAGALGAGVRYAVPAAQAAYNARTNSGANLTGTMMAAKQAAATPFNNDVAAVKQAAGNVAGAAQNGYNNVVGAAQNAAQVVANPSGFKSGYGMAMKDPLLGKMAADIGNPSVRAGAKVGNVANTIGKTISNIRTKVTRRA
jgi:hypothetical protein